MSFSKAIHLNLNFANTYNGRGLVQAGLGYIALTIAKKQRNEWAVDDILNQFKELKDY